MLTPWHYVAIAAPLVLLIIERKRQRSWVLVVIVAAIFLSSMQAIADLRIRSMRNRAVVPISSMPRESSIRKQFGILHGLSTLLLVGQVIAAGVVVAAGDKEKNTG